MLICYTKATRRCRPCTWWLYKESRKKTYDAKTTTTSIPETKLDQENYKRNNLPRIYLILPKGKKAQKQIANMHWSMLLSLETSVTLLPPRYPPKTIWFHIAKSLPPLRISWAARKPSWAVTRDISIIPSGEDFLWTLFKNTLPPLPLQSVDNLSYSANYPPEANIPHRTYQYFEDNILLH